jgi:putative membrane protein
MLLFYSLLGRKQLWALGLGHEALRASERGKREVRLTRRALIHYSKVMRDGILLRFVIRWVVSTAAVAVTTWLLQPHIRIEGAEYLSTVILVGLVLGLLNALVRPIIIFLTLPATLVTFGLFLIVINAGMLWLTDLLIPAFVIENFGWALLGALLISLVSMILYAVLKG